MTVTATGFVIRHISGPMTFQNGIVTSYSSANTQLGTTESQNSVSNFVNIDNNQVELDFVLPAGYDKVLVTSAMKDDGDEHGYISGTKVMTPDYQQWFTGRTYNVASAYQTSTGLSCASNLKGTIVGGIISGKTYHLQVKCGTMKGRRYGVNIIWGTNVNALTPHKTISDFDAIQISNLQNYVMITGGKEYSVATKDSRLEKRTEERFYTVSSYGPSVTTASNIATWVPLIIPSNAQNIKITFGAGNGALYDDYDDYTNDSGSGGE